VQCLHFSEGTEVLYAKFDQHEPLFVSLSQMYDYFDEYFILLQISAIFGMSEIKV